MISRSIACLDRGCALYLSRFDDVAGAGRRAGRCRLVVAEPAAAAGPAHAGAGGRARHRSEEHTSELQSQSNLVCRLLLEKKKYTLMSWAHYTVWSTTSLRWRPARPISRPAATLV